MIYKFFVCDNDQTGKVFKLKESPKFWLQMITSLKFQTCRRNIHDRVYFEDFIGEPIMLKSFLNYVHPSILYCSTFVCLCVCMYVCDVIFGLSQKGHWRSQWRTWQSFAK